MRSIKVTIEFTDVFNQKQIGVAGIEGYDVSIVDYSDLEFIITHCKQAIKALGFSEKQIENELTIVEEKEED